MQMNGAYIHRDGCEYHGVGHGRFTIDETIRLRKCCLYVNVEDQLEIVAASIETNETASAEHMGKREKGIVAGNTYLHTHTLTHQHPRYLAWRRNAC